MTDPALDTITEEEQLVGAILTAPASAKKVSIEAEHFYSERLGRFWDAAVKCANNGGADPILVAAELERRGEQTPNLKDRLTTLALRCERPGSAKAYARRIREKYELRRVHENTLKLLEAVKAQDEPAIAIALEALGNPVRFVDFESGEMIESCPTCDEKEQIITKLQHDQRSKLSRISTLEGKAEKTARSHRLWDEIECVHMWWRAATGHYRMKFGTDEFTAALPRWKENGRGKANPAMPALKAVAGAAYDPTTTTMRNGQTKRYDDWSLVFRNQEKFAAMQERAPVKEGQPEFWKVWLWQQVQRNLK